MKKSTYWDKRALERLSSAEKHSDVYINRVKNIYNQANKDIDKQLASIYRNYSNETGINVQKLKELLTRSETKKTWEQMKRQGLDKYVKANYKSRISRLEQLKAQVYARAKAIYPKEELENTMCYKGVIHQNYYKTIYDTQVGTGYDFNFSTIDNNMVDALLKDPWSGKNYSQRIWGNTDILADSLSEILGGAMLSGQGMELTAKQISDRFNVSKYYAERLIRTETNHFNNEADAMAYEEMGVKQYVFVATLDNRTSEMCQGMDNKVFKYSERQEGINYPPLHPNCRSTTRGYLGEEVEKNLQRRARNPITGKTELVDNISYKDWIKQYKSNNNVTKNVDKVVKINTKTQNTVLNSNIKELSNKIYDRFKDNHFENLGVINPVNGEIVGDINTSNMSYTVGFSNTQKELMKKYNRELYAIHNHPANHTFSLEDIYELFNNDSLSGIIVRTDEYNYYFMPTINDLDITKEHLKEFKEWFEETLGNTNDKLLGMYPNKSNNELQHLAFEEIFKKLGWKYGREKI